MQGPTYNGYNIQYWLVPSILVISEFDCFSVYYEPKNYVLNLYLSNNNNNNTIFLMHVVLMFRTAAAKQKQKFFASQIFHHSLSTELCSLILKR
jgi:hypothetical protein